MADSPASNRGRGLAAALLLGSYQTFNVFRHNAAIKPTNRATAVIPAFLTHHDWMNNDGQ